MVIYVALCRQDDNTATLTVEVQVLRDRIQHVSAMEDEINHLKEKNLHLNRQVKDLERSISERKEGWNLDNLMADGDDIEGSSKTLVDLENKVLTLKEVNNELKGVNAKLMKEQHQHIMASKNAEKRLKLCLQDNLGLNQKMNRLEEDYNNSKIEVSDLLGQIEHQRDTEQERLQVRRLICWSSTCLISSIYVVTILTFLCLLISLGCQKTSHHWFGCD